MPKVIYSMSVSLDGYTAGPDGTFDWTAPDEELHRFHNDRVREQGAELCGRRLYESMLYWERPEALESDSAAGREFAPLWRQLPKIVFSSTLTEVEGNTRLAEGTVAEEIARAKSETGREIGIGGPTLAAAAIEQDLVDEYLLFVCPVIVGGGTPFFPPGVSQTDLELVETRTFSSRVVYLRYRRARP
jgi:dihydrofolate reductase